MTLQPDTDAPREMSERAEKLRAAMMLRAPKFFNHESNENLQSVWAELVAKDIVTELGITERDWRDLAGMKLPPGYNQDVVARAAYALSTLLEVASDG